MEDLEALISGGVAPDVVLERENQGCVTFRVSNDSDARLRRAGATTVLISALHSSCRVGEAARRVQDPPRSKTIVKHDTVIVRAPVVHDTVVRELVHPDPVIPRRTYYSYKFPTDRNAYLTSPSDTVCSEHFSSTGYSLTTLNSRQMCAANWPMWLPAAVRIEAAYAGVINPSPLAAGIEFGVDSVTWDYYTFQVNQQGEFAIFQRVGGVWHPLLPYQKSAALRMGSAVNVIAVEIRGAQLVFFANGTPIARYTTLAPSTGRAGFGLFASPAGGTVELYSFKVEQVD